MDTEKSSVSERKDRFMRELWPHVDALHGTAWHLIGRSDRVEDCVQEALCRAWKYLDSFKGTGSPRSWLLSILRNVILDEGRRRTREPATSLDDLGWEPEDSHAPDLEQGIAAAEAREAMAELPVEFRSVMLLSIVQGFKYRETAAALGIPVGTVMSRLYRGRKILRDRLTPPAEKQSKPARRVGR